MEDSKKELKLNRSIKEMKLSDSEEIAKKEKVKKFASECNELTGGIMAAIFGGSSK